MRALIVILLIFSILGCGEDTRPKPKTYQNENPLIESGKWSQLHEAVETQNLEAFNALLEKKIDVNIVSAEEELRQLSPLHLSVRKGSLEMAQKLIDAGADVNLATTTGWTALHLAVDSRNPGMVELLVKSGADLDADSLFVHKPYKYAEDKGYKELLPLLKR
jgi:ankyrin repeat protein